LNGTCWGVGATRPDIYCPDVAPDIKQNATSGLPHVLSKQSLQQKNGPLRRTLHMHVSRRAATRKKKKKSSFTLLSLKKKITFWSEGRCRRTLSQP
jgi:hypothetical protein